MTGTDDTDHGIVRIASHHTVAETVDRIESLLKQRGILVFARIDFSADAGQNVESAVCPFAVGDRVWIAYNDPRYVVRRHALASALTANLAAAVPILEQAAQP